MKKKTQNFLVDGVGFAGFVFLIGTGVLMRYVLPPGSGSGLTVWGMDRHGWGSIHFWLAVTFLTVLAIHLFLHWRWIVAMVQGRPREDSGMRVGLGLAGLAALIALALSPVVSPVARDLSGDSHETEVAGVEGPADVASHEAEVVKGWMTLAEVEQVTGTPATDLIASLGLPAEAPLDVAVRELGEEHGFHVEDVRTAAAPQSAATRGPGTGPRDLLEEWVGLWASHDLSDVPQLFLGDERLTYFSSEREGLIVGPEAVQDHHAGFGFVAGGSQPGSQLWVDEVAISDFGATAVVSAIWYFGDPADAESAQKGPMTMMVVDEGSGYRIAHMNFAEYLATETE